MCRIRSIGWATPLAFGDLDQRYALASQKRQLHQQSVLTKQSACICSVEDCGLPALCHSQACRFDVNAVDCMQQVQRSIDKRLSTMRRGIAAKLISRRFDAQAGDEEFQDECNKEVRPQTTVLSLRCITEALPASLSAACLPAQAWTTQRKYERESTSCTLADRCMYASTLKASAGSRRASTSLI